MAVKRPAQKSLTKALAHDRALLVEGENEVLRLIIEGTPLPVVLKELAKVAERQGPPGMLATILLVDKGGQHLRFAAAPGFPPSFAEEAGGIPIGPASGACGAAAFRRATVLVTDVTSDELGREFRDFAAKYEIGGCWSMPIISSGGGLLGTFALYYKHPYVPAETDIAVLEILTRTCALAIERSQSEDKLAESEERLRSLSRCSPIGIFTTNVERTFMYVNPRFREISAYGYEKNVEYWLHNAVDPAHRERVLALWERSAADRLEFSEEFPVLTESGEARWVSLRAATLNSSLGEHIGYVGTIEDVSERRRAESELRSESAFRLALEESIPCGIVTFNLDGERTYVNRAYAEMMGCSPEELIGEGAPFSCWPPEERPKRHEQFLQMLSGDGPKDGRELKFQRKNGELFFALVTFSELLDASQQRCGWVNSVLDITEWKRAEESLRLSEAGLQLAMEVGKMGGWEWDIVHNTIKWSPQVEKIHGLEPGTFGGTFDDFQEDMNPDHRPRVLAAIEEALRERTAYRVEYEILRPDGERVWLEAIGQVFSNERGEPIKMAGICMDITAYKAREKQAVR
jgi:PAS domain S-box-containing protein